jgi:protoporphyrinogen/coproporphyrinogen III oxidase
MPRVVIVGAGISGLSLGYRVQQLRPDADVTVLEAATHVGGTVRTDHRDGFTVECGPNGFLDSKPTTVTLCQDLGVRDRLLAASETSRKHRCLFVNERLQALPGGIGPFLRSPLLSLRGKLTLLAEPFRRRRRDDSDESVAAFATRRAGREAAALFADALCTGIHGGDPELLSVRAAFPRLTAFEAEHSSVVRGMIHSQRQKRAEARARGESPSPARLWSFREGLHVLTDTLRDRLRRPPVTGVRANRLEQSPTGWLVHGDGRDFWQPHAVVLACPADEQARLLADVDPALADLIGGIAYNRIAVVALGFRASDVPASDGFGFIAPQSQRRDILGVQWCSSIFPGRAPDGMILWRALCGGWHRADVVDWDDGRLVAAVRAELRLAQGATAEPAFVHVVRWRRAIPQYFVGHSERVAAIEERAAHCPGLFLAGNAYHGVALNDCTERATVIAGRVAAYLPPSV